MDKQDEIRVMKHFINNHTTEEIAEFIVNLNDSVDRLSENMREFSKAYREILDKEQDDNTKKKRIN